MAFIGAHRSPSQGAHHQSDRRLPPIDWIRVGMLAASLAFWIGLAMILSAAGS